MPLWRINTPSPGAYVEGFGLIPTGTEIDLPEKHVVRRLRDGKSIRVRVKIKARATWEPLDDTAKVLFEEFREALDEAKRAAFDTKHASHKNPDQHPDEEVVEDRVEAGLEEEEVDEDETVVKPKPRGKAVKPAADAKAEKRASDT